MKERAVDLERAVVAHQQAAEVPQPADGAFNDPAFSVSAQRPAILRGRTYPILLVRADQFNATPSQAIPQWIAVVSFVGNHAHRLLAWSARSMLAAYADRCERRFRQPDFRRGCRVKLVSQRNTLAVDHHHPLRALAPLGFPDSCAPFFAGAKLPSKNDSLQSSSSRSFNSLKKARQMFSQTPCSSQSRSRRQHVEGCGYFSGRSCQRAPLRRIHKIPSNTRRLSIHGRPPLRCLGGLGSKGAILFHCASVSNGRDRAIDPPSALLTLLIAHFKNPNHPQFNALYPVVQQLLVKHLDKKKIIICGDSWGSILGIHMAHARPDLFYAYVGNAQLVNTRKNDLASYTRVLELARASGDQQAINALTTIGPPPWNSLFKSWPVFRKWRRAYQAKRVTAPPAPETLSPAYASPEEQAQYAAADDFCFEHFWGLTMSGPLETVDLPAMGTDFAIPIFILQGQEDLTALPELAKAYFDSIKAPRKEFYLVPGTGHGLSATELDLTRKVLLEQVRPLAISQ